MRRFIVTVLLAATAGVLVAQQPPSAPQPPVTFRVEVNFVELDAIVTDEKGNLIRGLTKDDFELFEEGQPQQIATFSAIDLPTPRPDPPLARSVPIDPDVKTNIKAFDGRVIVLVLDDLMTDARRSFRVRAAASQFVRRFVSANDLVAVVHTGSGARLGQDFTSSHSRLLAAIEKFQGQKIPSQAAAMLDDYWKQWRKGAEDGAARDTMDEERSHKARSSLSTIESVSRFLGNIRGRRKALVWFGEGIDYDIERVFDAPRAQVIREDMRATIDTATRAGVSFYAVDARGLSPGLDQIADLPGLPLLRDDFGAPMGPGAIFDEVRRAQDLMRTMSAETGGFAVVNQEDLNGAFARIILDNSSYYLLGYYPTNDKRDGKYRRFQVRVKRPGLRVRHRDGYTAPKGRVPTEPTASTGMEASPELRAALDSPVPVSGLGLRVFAAPFAGPARKSSVAVVVEIDPKGLSFRQQDGGYTEELEVVIVPVDPTGKAREGTRDVAPMRLSQATYDLIRANGFAIARRIDLAPGRYQLHVAARATNSRAVGSLAYDLDVPDFSKVPLSLSGLAVSSIDAARVPTPQPEKGFLEVLPQVPTTRREFAASDTLSVLADIYDNRASTPHRVAIATTVIGDDGRLAFNAADERSSEEIAGKTGGYVHQARIPLRGFAPGRYVLRVEARIMLSEGAVASRELEFTVR